MSSSHTPHTPAEEDAWCDARRAEVLAHLQRTALAHGRVGDAPAWLAMPYASIWAVESQHRPEWIGWWVICGDLPTDALPAQGVETPRAAMRAIGQRWVNHTAALEGGEVPQAWRYLSDAELLKLIPQLRKRGPMLVQWADEASSWPVEPGAEGGGASDEDD
jgi:hypothetical protein